MYQTVIQKIAEKVGRTDLDPRHIEAYMRIEHPTLDGLPFEQFKDEVLISIACIDLDGLRNAEQCALSFGL